MADNNEVNYEELSEYITDGYYFRSKETAEDARNELNAIKYLSAKTDLKDPKSVYILYNRIIEKELFKTVIGISYLKQLQNFLYASKVIPDDKIRPIPIDYELQELLNGRREITHNRGLIRNLKRDKQRYRESYNKIVIVNILLVIAIIIMIVITLTSSNPTVIDYENKLQDKYATWKEQLESREASIREAERKIYGE